MLAGGGTGQAAAGIPAARGTGSPDAGCGGTAVARSPRAIVGHADGADAAGISAPGDFTGRIVRIG
ncbi:hypothetical protein Maq22A_c14675 [Methylobacterium aquaticum]|uniref:Uncharacterized protein n=1 Tax=Methylobacterium aquaticum TaxID=270351 RepID=A0A0C6FC83_9HYPH|nr:hypothetical protein Maq22A_c14675 [Methylobacterium aquaticum]